MPVALLEVSVTLPPVQKVVGPPGVIVGVAGRGLMVTFVDADLWQPPGSTTFRVRMTVPEAPAVYVTVCVDPPPVMVPLVMPQA